MNERRTRITGLRRRIDHYRIGDGRQRCTGKEELDAGTRYIKVDRIESRVIVGVRYSLLERPRARTVQIVTI
jgi:hypothetical protein